MKSWENILLEKISFVEKVLSDLGAIAVGEIEFDSHRFNMNGEELYSANDAHIIWYLDGYYIKVDTILFPDVPCLTLEFSDEYAGPYEDADLFPYNLSEEEMIQEIQKIIVSESTQ